MPTGPKGEKRPADVIGNAARSKKLSLTTAKTRQQKHLAKRAALRGLRG